MENQLDILTSKQVPHAHIVGIIVGLAGGLVLIGGNAAMFFMAALLPLAPWIVCVVAVGLSLLWSLVILPYIIRLIMRFLNLMHRLEIKQNG